MMKKALLSLLLAVVCLPLAFGQTKDGRAFATETLSSCNAYTWRDGMTYTSDTVVTYITTDTIFVLEFTRLSTVVDTANVRAITGGCMATWNGRNWTAPGIFFDTVASTGDGCDTLVKIEVTLTGTDLINTDTVVCGNWTAPWGDVYTASRSFDTVIVGTCNVSANFNLTVHTEYRNLPVVEVVAGCSYEWFGLSINDTATYVRGLQTAEGCDSIVRLRVTAFDGQQYDETSVVACDTYTTPWNTTVTVSGTYTHDTTYGTYYVNPTTTAPCQHHETYQVTIVNSVSDSANVTPTTVTAGCSYTWAGHVYTDTNTHYHLFTSIIGGCDSMAGIRVTYTGHHYDTTYTRYCGSTYNWKTSYPSLPLPGHDSLYRYTHDTIATVTVEDATTGCTTHYTLALTFYSLYDTVVPSGSGTSGTDYYCGESYTYQYKRFNPYTNMWQDASTSFTTSGYHAVSADGMDSLITVSSSTNCKTYHTLHLSLNYPELRYRSESIDTAACESFRFKADRQRGRWITLTTSCDSTFVHSQRSQFYTDQCYDSIVHVHLVINHNSFIERTATACDSYTWDEFDGNTYTKSGTYRDTLDVRTDEGCLQIGRLTLTIYQTPTIDIQGEWALQPGESTLLRAVPSEDSDPISTYRWYINDTLRSSTDSLEVSNVYHNTDVQLLSTSINHCTAENWITITSNVGIADVEALQVNIYPNPASRYITIESGEAINEVTVYNNVGQQVVNRTANGNSLTLDLGGLSAGSYTLRIAGADGSLTTRKFIVNK